MGNMTCRNTDTTTAHSCDTSQTGATMTYDNMGRLSGWTAPSGTTASDSFLYDNAGQRVLQRTVNSTGVTDTITFDSYTEVTISGSTTATTKYYSADGLRVAMRKNGTLSYLAADILGSNSLALNSDGSTQSVRLFAPFGSVRYSDGTMPTTYSFTGQRLDSQTGLLYYGFRYYDPVSGTFTRTDTTITNAQGADTYAYVGSNPEGRTDANGHCWPLCTAIAGAIIGGIVGGAISVIQQSSHGGKVNWGEVGGAVAGGAAIGAAIGAVGPAVIAGGAAIAGFASISAAAAVTTVEATSALSVGLSVGSVASTVEGVGTTVAGTLAEGSGGANSTTFYTVQSAADRQRLYNGGDPWPTSPSKAHLGPGVYAWSNEDDASTYYNKITSRPEYDSSADVQIVPFKIDNSNLDSYSYLNVDSLGDDGANDWLSQTSSLWGGDPSTNAYDWVQKGVGADNISGPENYFSSNIFDDLNFNWDDFIP